MALKVGELYAALTLNNKDFLKGLDQSGSKFGMLKGAIVGGAAVAAAAIVAMGAAAFKIGMDYDDAVDRIRVGTGATGEDLKALEKSFQNVAKRVPEDMGAVGQVIADLNTRTGQTGQGLEDLATNILDFSRLTKTDVNANVAAATRMFGDWSIATENQAGTLDKVYRASQSTGIGVTELMDTVVQFGSPMRLLGLSFEESIALIGKWEKEGVNSQTAFAGLKMAVKSMAAEGIKAADMGESFRAKLEAIKTSADPVGESIKLFGVRAGPDLAAAILEGRFATEDLVNAINNGADTVSAATDDTRNFGEIWGIISNTLSVSIGELLLPMLNGLAEWFMGNMPAIQAIMEQAGVGMAGVVTMLGELFGWLQANVLPLVAAGFEVFTTDIMPGLQEAFRVVTEDVIPALGAVFDWIRTNILPPVQAIFQAYIDNILPALADAFKFVQKWITDNWPMISKIVGQVAGAVKTAFNVVAAVIKAVFPVIREVANVIFPMIGAAASLVLEVVSRVFDAIGAVWQTAADVADTVVKAIFGSWEGMGDFFKTLFNTVSGVVKGGINFLIKIVNGMIRQINGIQVHIPKIGIGDVAVGPFDWNGLNLPTIPLLARGTRGFGGGWAVLGENGPELARLPRGTDVFNTHQSRDMMGAAAGQSGGITQHIYGVQPGDVERETRRALRRQALTWALEGK